MGHAVFYRKINVTFSLSAAGGVVMANRSGTACIGGPGSSIGIATDYGLDGPGSNPDGDEISRPSRPALELTQPPAQGVPDLSRG